MNLRTIINFFINYVRGTKMTNLNKLNSLLENFVISRDFVTLIQSTSDRIEEYIDKIARQIYYMRNKEKLQSYFNLETVELTKFYGKNYSHVERINCPDYGDPEVPIVSVQYVDYRTGNYQIVTFPQSYLGIKWESIEQHRIDEENRKILEKKKQEDYHRLNEKLEKEFKEYERLRMKFEGL